MIHTYSRSAVIMGLALAWSLGAGAQVTTRPVAEVSHQLGDSLTLRERFAGTLTVRPVAGSRPLRVSLRHWVINGSHTIRQLADSGFLVVQLRSGSATVSIGDRRFEPTLDTFFVVPAGATMGVTTGRDEAVFEVLSIRDP